MSSRSITMPDRELSFVKRHFGTDVLAAGWLLLLATFFYTAYSILFLMEMWGDTFPRVFFAWDNLIASLVFVVAGVYFALLGYPDQLEEFDDPLAPGAGIDVVHPKPELDVLPDISMWEERVILEHQAERADLG